MPSHALRPFTLAFADPELERRFRRSAPAKLRAILVSLVVSAVFWYGFVWIGPLAVPSSGPIIRATMWELVTPIYVLGLGGAFVARRWALPGVTLGLSVTVCYLQARLGAPYVLISCLALGPTLIAIQAGMRLRFAQSFVLSWAVVTGYALVILALAPVPRPLALVALFFLMLGQLWGLQIGYATERARRRLFLQQLLIDEERAKSERLVRNMLPEIIAERLKREPGAIADAFDQVTVLFADIVGFTPMSEKMSASAVVRMLNEIFSAFDALVQERGLEKIKTIGDAYMVVGGLPAPRADHATAVAELAVAMQAHAARLEIALRIGIHTGPVVAGVIGTTKYSYDLWGDTVNTASRMESHGTAGRIHVTDAGRAALGEGWVLEDRGLVEIKGKGPMRTWFLERKD